MDVSPFLALDEELVIEIIDPVPPALLVSLRSTSLPSRCPLCSHSSERLHSQYQRTGADVPCGGQFVSLHVIVRKFRCLLPTCPRKIFTDDFPGWFNRGHERPIDFSKQYAALDLLSAAKDGLVWHPSLE